MSVYEGTITLRVRFYASGGVEADESLRLLAIDLMNEENDHAERDPDDDELPAAGYYIVVGSTAGQARRA